MDLSPQEIAQIKDEVESIVRSLHAAHLARGKGSLEHFLAFFDHDVIGIGTGKDEVVFNKEDLLTLLKREWRETPDSLHYALHSVDVRVLSAESASAQSFIDIFFGEPRGDSLHARLTTVFRKVDGRWKSVHWHASVPWEVQPEGVSWPVDELKARAQKLEQEVAARTEELSRANRALAVDAALERIRRVTVAMQQPSDLTEVVKQIKREVDLFFPDQNLEVDLMAIADESHYRFWAISEVAEVPDAMEQYGVLYPRFGE
ncbi:MAG: nuclear transport factor 2 family protein, partial [Bacteroidetes bacterium]|nr:nuclear transport factor 2 family protein [Bacteroidota bacterium]